MSNGANSNTSGANEAKLRMKPAGDNDRLPQSVVEELVRRGFVSVEVTTQSNLVIQPTEPEDKTKVWWQSDINGVPQGSPLTYNTSTGRWEATAPDFTPYVPPLQRNGSFFAPAAGSTQTVEFDDIKTSRYHVTLTPTLLWADVWHTPPVSFPSNFGYFIANKSSTIFTVQLYGIPTGGLGWEWQVTEIPADPTAP